MQRLVVWSTLSYILSTAGMAWDDSRFWCVIALLWVLEYLSGIDGGIRGTDHLLSMPREQLLELKDFMDRVTNGDKSASEDELNEIMKKKEDRNANK